VHGAKHLWRRVCRELCRHNIQFSSREGFQVGND
jgi:hypothetical protein